MNFASIHSRQLRIRILTLPSIVGAICCVSLSGCGGDDEASSSGSGGEQSEAGSGAAAGSGGHSGTGGAGSGGTASGGTASGGATTGGAGSGGLSSSGGTDSSAGGSQASGGNPGSGGGGPVDSIAGGFNCDASQVVTDDVMTPCPTGELRSVSNGQWSACVPMNECGCESPGQAQCGDGLSYTCYNTNRCGDLLK